MQEVCRNLPGEGGHYWSNVQKRRRRRRRRRKKTDDYT
jgi:hypothetical protein